MVRNFSIVALLAVIIALPFIFRRPPPSGQWKPGDPVLTIVTPHNEAIRYEFSQGFSKWHQQHYGKPVKIDWRNIGGTTEISRYLTSEYATATKAWWTNDMHKAWPATATDDLTRSTPPKDQASAEIWKAYRSTDGADKITCKIDLFFGGGEVDHSNAFRSGFAVPVVDELPPTLFRQGDVDMIPATFSGETWRTPSVMGNVVSTFGIIYNVDRLKGLNIDKPPTQWTDLADYRYFGQIGLADPTKSGSIAKAFEMIVHQQMHNAAVAAGYDSTQIAANEKIIDAYRKEQGAAYKRGDVPIQLRDYQAALERGFVKGLQVLQEIGANSRYYTDSGSKVPIDVSVGDAAVGMAIDFFGRYQAQATRAPDGTERMKFVTPVGGTSVSVDPISLLRGAGGTESDPSRQKMTRDVALHFIEFLLGDDGQKLWTFKPGTPGGPEKYALRRLPIRRSFYPSTNPAVQATAAEYDQYAADDLADPQVDPYEVGRQFTYYQRWTNDHFTFLRDLVRAMCMDAGDELKHAWRISNEKSEGWAFTMPTISLTDAQGGRKDVTLTWKNAPDLKKNYDSVEYARALMLAFRDQYAKVH